MTETDQLPPRAQAILDFWFGPAGSDLHGAFRELWFKPDAAFDTEIEQRFLADYEDAAAGRLAAFDATPRGRLAHILLLDQVPRNVFRGTARAFATDAMALEKAKAALAAGADSALSVVERMFLYMPFQHAEDLAEQETSLRLYAALGPGKWIESSERHHEIVARFGRFPHRNAALGRATTAEEAAFLEEPNSSF